MQNEKPIKKPQKHWNTKQTIFKQNQHTRLQNQQTPMQNKQPPMQYHHRIPVMWNNEETKQKETKRNIPKQTKIKTKRNELKPKSFCLKTVDIYWWSTLVIHYCSIFSKKVIIKQSFLELWFMHMMHDERNLFYNTQCTCLIMFLSYCTL